MQGGGLVRERLAQGDMGELRAVKVRFLKHLPEVVATRERSICAPPHEILLDMSVHHVDLLRYMTQHEVTSVVAVEHDTPDNAFKHPSNALCLMRLEGEIPVVWDGDWCARGAVTSWEGEWQFVGSRGRLFWDGVVDESFRTSVRLEIPGQETQELMSLEPVQERRLPLLEHFIESIGRSQQPVPSIEVNSKTLSEEFWRLVWVLKKRDVC